MRRSILGAAALVALSACGSPATDNPPPSADSSPTAGDAASPGSEAPAEVSGLDAVLAEVEGLSGQERRDKLVELAQQEGSVDLYTSMNGDIVQEVGDAFEDEFDVAVNIYRASSEAVLQRLVQEAGAGYRGADLAETNGTEMFALSKEGILVPVESPVTGDLAEGSVFADWTATRFNFFAAAWNTGAVADAPARWEDLADPRWDGRMAMELGDADWFMALRDYWLEAGRSEEEVAQLFEDMASGSVTVKGHTLMTELLAAGEYDLATSNYSYIVQALVDDGAPVAWQPPVEPVIARPNGIGIVEGAPHPAATLLFYEWILSDGQETLVEQGIDASRKDLLSTGDAEITFVDLEAFSEQRPDLEAEYDALMQLGSQVDD